MVRQSSQSEMNIATNKPRVDKEDCDRTGEPIKKNRLNLKNSTARR